MGHVGRSAIQEPTTGHLGHECPFTSKVKTLAAEAKDIMTLHRAMRAGSELPLLVTECWVRLEAGTGGR